MTKDQNKLTEFTILELIDLYNAHSLEHQISSWKKAKIELVEKIVALDSYKMSKKGNATIRTTALLLMCEVAYYEDKTQKPSSDNRVEADHPEARSVGYTYMEIIKRIKDKFPNAKTTVACLRWYGVKARVEEAGYEGFKLAQRRPRAKNLGDDIDT